MARPSDDAASVLTDALTQTVAKEQNAQAQISLAADASVEVIPEAGAEIPPPNVLEPSQETAMVEPTQVAGLGDKIMGLARKRTLDAEKKILPKLKADPVQAVGDTLLIRPLEQDEIDRIGTVLGGDYTKGINLPKIADDMGVTSLGDYLARLKDANAALFEEARRGTLNFEALLAKANAKDVDAVIYDWLQRAPGQGAVPEDVLAGLLASVQLTKETQGAWVKALTEADPVLRQSGMQRAAQMMAIEAELYARISGAGSEAGRTLYVLSQGAKMGGVDMTGRSDQLIKLFGAETAEDLEYLGQAYLALPNPASRAAFVKQGMLSKSMDVMGEVYINSLLSSPTTHVVNVLGNSSFMGTRILETAVAGGIGRIRSAITGNTDRVYAREAVAQLEGIRDGFMDAMIVAGKSFITEEGADIGSKIELRNRRAIGTSGDPAVIVDEFRNGNYVAGAVNVLGVSVRMPGRFLLAEDEFFKGVGYRMFLHQEAKLQSIKVYDQAIQAGKTVDEALGLANMEASRILNDPPQSVIKSAQDAAREMTFQKDLDGFLGATQEALSHPVAKLFVPFFRTPTNIATAIIERSPIQFVNPGFYRALQAGGREADIAMAKVATGSMIMGGFATWASGSKDDGDVLIHGAGPSDPKARDAFMRKGFLPYSISIKQDDGTYKSVTYNRFDPVSGILAMAADFSYYAQHESDGKVLDDLAMAATMSIANYMMEQPLLQGVNEIASAFVIPDKKQRTEKLLKIMGEKAGEAAFSFAPGTGAMSSAIARNQDPVAKNTMPPDEGLFGEDVTKLPAYMQGFYTALQKAKSQNPFFNQKLPPRLNEWAEPMLVADGTAWDFFSPVKIKNSVYAPVDDEIMRLGKGFSPTDKKINGVDLTASQYNRHIVLNNSVDEFGRLPGEKGYDERTTMLPTLQRFIQSPEYLALPTKDDQAEKLSNVVSLYRSAARKKLLEEDSYLASKVAAKK